jgi:hypothetical protein
MAAPEVARGELSMQHLPRSGHDTTGLRQVNDLAGRKFEMSKFFVGIDQQGEQHTSRPKNNRVVFDDMDLQTFVV